MTNFEKIETYLKKGLHVLVKDNVDDYTIISPFKDSDGNYRDSGYWSKAETAKKQIADDEGNDAKYWNELIIEIIETFPNPYEPYQVGDKVRIRKNGWVGTVAEISSSIEVMTDSVTSCVCEHFDLEPVIKEDDEVAKAIALLESRGKIKDGKILT